MMKTILSRIKVITGVLSPAAVACAIIGGWFIVVPVLAIAFYCYFIIWVYSPSANALADAHYWTVPSELVDRLMPEYTSIMNGMGYRKENYLPEVHDCDDYAGAGIVALHGLLLRERKNYPEANGKADPLFQFSFLRSDVRKRHRLFFVNTDKGRIYIDNWEINGSMYRKLNTKEEANGRAVV